MKKYSILLIMIMLLSSSCLFFFADPSIDPSRTFMKSLAKKDGDWTLSQISLKAYIEDPMQPGVLPAIDETYFNTGVFHFDNYDGDIDGTGTFTPNGKQENAFTFKVPDFEESTTTEPDISIFFTAYPVMICRGNDYREADSYTITGSVYEDVDYFPLADLPQQNYKKFEFSFVIERK